MTIDTKQADRDQDTEQAFQMVEAANLWIGRSQFANDPTFHGLVSDFRLYRGALSDAQVAALASG